MSPFPSGSPANPSSYLAEIAACCRTDWPNNRTVNFVCHGHSVPSGYFHTPEVRSLDAYPHLLREALAERYPHAILNVIVTGIGGETSDLGAQRFERDVLSHRPDVLTIDYALNDRQIGLDRAREAWVFMIKKALARDIKVLLLTPTADGGVNLDDPAEPLFQHAAQIRELAAAYGTGLVDSLEAFRRYVHAGGCVHDLLSQVNHPNRKGHELVATALREWLV